MLDRLQWYGKFLTSDPLGFAVYAVYFTVTVLLSLILHEISHGYIALKCGDPTAKMMGRLSLNPAKHLDPLGAIFMFFVGFGWAKPVPVNPNNFRSYRRDDFLVSIAGICMNLILMTVCTFLSVVVTKLMWEPYMISQYGVSYLTSWNQDTSVAAGIMLSANPSTYQLFLARPWLFWIQKFLLLMSEINVSLAVFNLLPIPPLDGFHLLNDTLLKGRLQLDRQMFQITQIVLIVLCFSGLLTGVLTTVTGAIYDGALNLFIAILGGA